MSQFVSVKDASQYLGVSASTFKRTCERYSIPLMRTTGGHRRIDRADLDRAFGILWRGAKRKLCSTEAPGSVRTDEIVDRLLEGSVDGVLNLLSPQIDRLNELSIVLESTLVSALWKIGELWRSGEIDVYQEHICSSTASTVLDILIQKLPNLDGQSCLAIGGTFESNFDTVGSKMVSLILRSIGMRTFNLGCNLPAASIAKAAQDLNASIVWICHTHVASLENILANHQLLRQSLPSSVRVVTGGGGLSPAMRRSLGDCLYFESFSLMSDVMKRSLQQF